MLPLEDPRGLLRPPCGTVVAPDSLAEWVAFMAGERCRDACLLGGMGDYRMTVKPEHLNPKPEN